MFKNIAPRGNARSVRRARRLRREMSLPEVLLWQVLRERPAGLKFRRQHPSGPYDLDFFCSDARLAIEVDGEAHDRAGRPARDAARDAWLIERGVETMRIPAVDVLKDLDAVVRAIIAEATPRLPLHHPATPGGPPPRDELGED
jgi:very-short-patch-repair endonuclease